MTPLSISKGPASFNRTGGSSRSSGLMTSKNSKPAEIRSSNIRAGKSLADAIRTSLGPRGMDKMIQDVKGEVTITNDGATILDQMKVIHPAAKMMVQLSKSQDAEAGDGTTTVVILAGSFLEAAEKLLKKGIHPTLISEAFQKAAQKSVELLMNSEELSIPISLDNKTKLLESAITSLNSKVVSEQSNHLAQIAVDAVLKVSTFPISDGKTDTKENVLVGGSCNMKDIRIIKKLGGTMEETQLVDGLVLTQHVTGSTKRVENAKVALIQFQVSAPKTDMDNQVVVSDYTAMDRVLREERAYLLNIVKQIKKAGCNVLLIQKSILRDALSDLAVHFFDKMKIMVVKDIERDEIEHICKAIGCRPIASLDHFTADNCVSLDLVEERTLGGSSSKCVFFTSSPSSSVNHDNTNGGAVVEKGQDAAPTGTVASTTPPVTGGFSSQKAEKTDVETVSEVSSSAINNNNKKERHSSVGKNCGSSKVVSIIIRGSNKLMLEEADRSIHDALCVIRCLVRTRLLVAGGGAPETFLYLKLREYAKTLIGVDAYCFNAFAEALEVIPYTLAENAGLNPVDTVTQLRTCHALGDSSSGINVRRCCVTNMLDEKVVQPMLVTTSAINLASETVRSILKIDDIVNVVH